jgi:hypothetical protein
MSLGLSLCWRGPPGSGKRHALQQQLQLWSRAAGQVYVVKRQLWDAPLQGGAEAGDGDGDADAEDGGALLPMEVSLLHWGFDVARMSLQDTKYIKSILSRWGRGGQVLTAGQRCLVFYHAHLLSGESMTCLQSFLEENHQDTVLWLTSEHTLPSRLADWCLEIPVGGSDRALANLKVRSPTLKSLEDEIATVYAHWMSTEPKLSDVKRVRALVYALLHRNIRWTEGFHHWMFALELLPLTQTQRAQAARWCAQQPFTGPGQTVPSYRIPVLWEHYLLGLRRAVAPAAPAEQPAATPSKKPRSKKHAASTHS